MVRLFSLPQVPVHKGKQLAGPLAKMKQGAGLDQPVSGPCPWPVVGIAIGHGQTNGERWAAVEDFFVVDSQGERQLGRQCGARGWAGMPGRFPDPTQSCHPH